VKRSTIIVALSMVSLLMTVLIGSVRAQTGLGTVATLSGRVSGVFENGVTYYRGVPYARPPVGNLRWAAPEDPPPWTGVRISDKYAPMCPQLLSTTDLWGPEFYYDWFEKDPPMSEDCLYLNVVTPATSSRDSYPVMVWFHGGASMHGYSWEPEFEPSNLVKKGVIVVSVGYRLGVFGFLATQALSDASPTKTSGNYGLLDQIHSLRWVQKNIAAFGGDPKRVTIAGQSAGAGAVCAVLTSPLAKGLFSRAIQSWRNSYFETRQTLADTQTSGMAYLGQKGYDGMSLQELRALPTSAFMSKDTPRSEVYGKGFGPCTDGHALTETPVEYFSKPNSLNGINLVFGSNSGDRNDSFTVLTREDIRKDARRTYSGLVDKYDFEKLYQGVDDAGASWEYWRLKNLQLATTNWVNAQVLSRLNPGSRIYQEYFDHWPPGRETELRRSFHSSDLWFTFYSLRNIPQQRDWRPVDHEIAEAYSSYWAHFIAAGDPNGGALPYWPNASRETPVFMEIGADRCLVRSSFYGGTKMAARDDFMREFAMVKHGFQRYFDELPPGRADARP
jgi:para-nitrobenzyl esterase